MDQSIYGMEMVELPDPGGGSVAAIARPHLMASVAGCAQVHDVAFHEADPVHVLGHHIDLPRPGPTELAHTVEISGWVVGKECGFETLVICHGRRTLRTSAIELIRPDVGAEYSGVAWAGSSGYHTLLDLLGVPSDYVIDLFAETHEGIRVKLGVIRGQRETISPRYRPRLQPIMVTSLGRMGTTWMMRLLHSHPEVIVHDRYPFEMRAGRYWLHMLRVLSGPSSPVASERDSFADDYFYVGRNPMFGEYIEGETDLLQWLDGTYARELADFTVRAIDEFYAQVGCEDSRARYWAEKGLPDHLPYLARELYSGAREIFLTRDIRDTLCSILAFNRKRGFDGFGRERHTTDVAYIAELGKIYTELLDAWRARAETAHLVRYEDLVSDPKRTLAGVLEYLDVDSSPSVVRRILTRATTDDHDVFQHHRTTGSAVASVGRWRQDLPAEYLDAAREHFSTGLEGFGYLKEPHLSELTDR